MRIGPSVIKWYNDWRNKKAKCCECGSEDCCNGVYARYDVATGKQVGCFIRDGVEECHECAEAHKLANEAKAALKSTK